MARIAVLGHDHHPIAEPYAGGIEMHTAMLCAGLVSGGHDVVLYAKAGSSAQGFSLRAIQPADYLFKRHPKNSLAALTQARQIREAYVGAVEDIDRDTFDYVINNSLSEVPLLWDNAVPMITVLHTPAFGNLSSAAQIAGAKANRGFVTVSHANANNWRPFVPQVDVVYNGIDLNKWRPMAEATEELRWAGRITPDKGLHLALDAAVIAGKVIRFAGPISDARYFDAEIRPRLSSTKIYAGHLSHDDLPKFLSEGAVALATPMWEEPFGLSVVEALACGTPIAAFPRGAITELVDESVGATSLGDSATSLATAIATASTKDRFACRQYARRFSTETMVTAYLDLLEHLGSAVGVSGVVA